mmetsp:Transcript_37102/g.76058  ORF Transcript_37102/g.76058 Transcript_37102/m.76058 type:complete len:231 (-) Transcript_37102:340-1032(-)
MVRAVDAGTDREQRLGLHRRLHGLGREGGGSIGGAGCDGERVRCYLHSRLCDAFHGSGGGEKLQWHRRPRPLPRNLLLDCGSRRRSPLLRYVANAVGGDQHFVHPCPPPPPHAQDGVVHESLHCLRRHLVQQQGRADSDWVRGHRALDLLLLCHVDAGAGEPADGGASGRELLPQHPRGHVAHPPQPLRGGPFGGLHPPRQGDQRGDGSGGSGILRHSHRHPRRRVPGVD